MWVFLAARARRAWQCEPKPLLLFFPLKTLKVLRGKKVSDCNGSDPVKVTAG